MNAKFVMEVTITELVNPLLYERLIACTTPRERAAVFRACAEAHLRDRLAGISAATGNYAAAGPRNDTPIAGSWRAEASVAEAATPSSAPGAHDPGEDFRTLRTEDVGGTPAAFSDILGSQLSDFFETK